MVRTADAATQLACKVSRLESELAVERHRRRQAEARAAGLHGALVRLRAERRQTGQMKANPKAEDVTSFC
jgi:hypothetical protein